MVVKGSMVRGRENTTCGSQIRFHYFFMIKDARLSQRCSCIPIRNSDCTAARRLTVIQF
jgi:hypothetical protein